MSTSVTCYIVHSFIPDKNAAGQNILTTLSTSSHVSQGSTHTHCSCVLLTRSCSFYDSNVDICLCSVVADPLNKPPELLQFLSQVASKARDEWEMMGLVLNIMPDQLNMISKKHHNPMLCYSEVFTTWKNKEKPAKFTWTTIVEALKSPVVEENKLAGDIVQWLTQ